MNVEAAEVCRKARDVLAERGWGQGPPSFFRASQSQSGRVCAAGALLIAADYNFALYGTAWDACTKIVGEDVPIWNDAPERTYEDVVLAMKHAEELLAGDVR